MSMPVGPRVIPSQQTVQVWTVETAPHDGEQQRRIPKWQRS